MELKVGRYVYRCSDGIFSMAKIDKEDKPVMHCPVSDVEINCFRPRTKLNLVASLFLVSPTMEKPQVCQSVKEAAEIQELYDYLRKHGAPDRKMNLLRAGISKHSAAV